MKIHYRVFGGPGQRRILAYGCGHSGSHKVTNTDKWRDVTCAACKRTAEWKQAAGQPKSVEHDK